MTEDIYVKKQHMVKEADQVLQKVVILYWSIYNIVTCVDNN